MNNGSSEAERNVELTRFFIDEVFNKGNVDIADEYMTEDFIENSPAPGTEASREGFKQWVTAMRASFPDLKATIERVVAQDDLVVVHIRQEGTNTGPMMGMPATGRKMNITGLDMVRIRDGKAAEHWGYFEEMKMMQQLGMMPEDGMAAESDGRETGNG
jgi:steroid delta-isomerase-like uncharacterized protein